MTEVNSEDPVIAAWHRRPLSSRVGSRSFRRRLIIATYAGWLVFAGCVKFLSYGPLRPPWLFLVLIGGNLIVQAAWVVRRTIISTPALVDAELDERLIQSRNAAFRTAFKIFAIAALISWLLAIEAVQAQPNNQGLLNSFILFMAVGLLATTLPTFIVAWREPDPAEPELSAR